MKDQHYVKYRDLGLSIFFFRKQKGMTQQQLADKMDVNYETISRIENANTGISMDMLFDLSNALETPLSELFSHAQI
ncbi:MAG: helix-turn-helix transcriptional regulator [Clostridia bacterium]|nr:helix-turn-helix transcriptional regulator [Clostridia bacterium]